MHVLWWKPNLYCFSFNSSCILHFSFPTCCALFYWPTESSWCCQFVYGCNAIHRSMGNQPTRDRVPEENGFPLHYLTSASSGSSDRDLTPWALLSLMLDFPGLTMSGSCAVNHSAMSLCAMALPYLEHTGLQRSSLNWRLHFFLLSSLLR